jgi:hypothetical protein
MMNAARLFLTLAVSFYSLESSAQIFKLKVTDYGSANPLVRTFIDEQIKTIEADINKDLPGGETNRLMKGMANSSVVAGKGIGTDYASHMDVLLVGAGVGVGADLAKNNESKTDISGAGIASGAIIGFNLGFMDSKHFLGMDTDRLNFYVNFMSLDKNFEIKEENAEQSSVDVGATSVGAHFRYDWIKGNGGKLFGWGGVKLNFGYEYNKNTVTFNSKINEAVNASGGPTGETLSGSITGSPKATIESMTHSIPLALSTDVRLLYFLTLYTGIGGDFNFGQAKGKGSIDAQPSTITCTGIACGGSTSIQVQPTANIDGKGKVDAFTARGFLGLQFNLPLIRIFVQADKVLGNDVVGATAGLRLVY